MPDTSTRADNPTVKYAEVTLGKGEDAITLRLAFDFNSLALAEQMTGLNLLQAMGSFGDLSVGQTRGLLFAAAIKKHPKLQLAKLGDMMTFENLPAITEALGLALAYSMPDVVEENPPGPDPDSGDPAAASESA